MKGHAEGSRNHPMHFPCLLLFFAFFSVWATRIMAQAKAIAAVSPSLADVCSAINQAEAGDTVIVPVGSARWSTSLTISKGISLIGAGIGNTNITCDSDYIIRFIPDAATRQNQNMFRISGFTFKGSPSYSVIGLTENNSEIIPIRNVRIDHNRWETSAGYPVLVDGNFWGCIDNNEFAGYNFFMIGGNQDTAWKEFYPVSFGTADNLYVEDNTFSGSYPFGIQSGQGGRWAFRHNMVNSTRMENPMFDQHGFQEYSTGVDGLMLCEIYENTFTYMTTGVNRWEYQRGGKLLMYNNTGASSTGYPSITENDQSWELTNDGRTHSPYDCYFFNNTWNGSRVDAVEGVDKWGTIEENKTFWNQKDGFNGSAGIGVGPLSARPVTCTTGVAYWATDAKTLYKATAPNTWLVYYTPYTYPHPLRK